MDPESLGLSNQDPYICAACGEENIGFGYAMSTFIFSCGHKFCVYCVKENFARKIQENDLKKLKCLYNNCKSKPTAEQLDGLFVD